MDFYLNYIRKIKTCFNKRGASLRLAPLLCIATPRSLRGFPKGSRGNLGSQTFGLRTVLAKANLLFMECITVPLQKYEIATPERFSVQARNDKSVDCFVALLFAITEGECHCEGSYREPVAISFSMPKTCYWKLYFKKEF